MINSSICVEIKDIAKSLSLNAQKEKHHMLENVSSIHMQHCETKEATNFVKVLSNSASYHYDSPATKNPQDVTAIMATSPFKASDISELVINPLTPPITPGNVHGYFELG